MTAYAAIQNPTNWNLKKKIMEKLENKGKAKSRDNNKLQKPAHNDILNIPEISGIYVMSGRHSED